MTLYPLPSFSPPTPLPKAQGAFSFAIHTVVEHVGDPPQSPSLGSETPAVTTKNKGVPVVVTYLAIGCRRKIVVYSWRDGEPQEVKVSPDHLTHF